MLVVVSKLIGGMLIGFVPMTIAAEESGHHCDSMTMDHSVMQHGTDHSYPDPHGSRPTHDGHCANGCQCGCTHAPASLFVPSNCFPAFSHPPQAHTADVLTVRLRPDVVFKPPI